MTSPYLKCTCGGTDFKLYECGGSLNILCKKCHGEMTVGSGITIKELLSNWEVK